MFTFVELSGLLGRRLSRIQMTQHETHKTQYKKELWRVMCSGNTHWHCNWELCFMLWYNTKDWTHKYVVGMAFNTLLWPLFPSWVLKSERDLRQIPALYGCVEISTRLQLIYLVQRVCIGFVADVKVVFELPQGPHAHPVVLLSNGQQQRSDWIVELRHWHWIPGAQEHNVCTTKDTKEQTKSITRNLQ